MARYRFIHAERARGEWPVSVMCRVLQVARAAFYAWTACPEREPEDELLLKTHIRAIHRRSRETYGSPRVLAELKEQGISVSRKRVARLMQECGLSGLPRKKLFKVATTDSDHDDPIANNLLNRNFEATEPNTVWVGDITYLRTGAGFAYLAVLIDLYSRRVVGWAVADHMRTELIQEALCRALTTRNPPAGLIHHSDRGSQYASAAYREDLENAHAVPSMSRKGDCWDNAVAESFFGTLEQELAGRDPNWTDTKAAQQGVIDYITTFYNSERRHSKVGQLSPAEFEARNTVVHRMAA